MFLDLETILNFERTPHPQEEEDTRQPPTSNGVDAYIYGSLANGSGVIYTKILENLSSGPLLIREIASTTSANISSQHRFKKRITSLWFPDH
jgi:hypothetical protein